MDVDYVVKYLFGHVEAHSDSIVVFADVANGGECAVAAQCGYCLEQGENLLRLKENADTRCVACGVTVEAEQ